MTKELTTQNKVFGNIGFGIATFGFINLSIGLSRLYFIAFDGIEMGDAKNPAYSFIGLFGLALFIIGGLITTFNYFVEQGDNY